MRFRYSPLNEIDEIRVIAIQNDEFDSQIYCRVLHATLSEHVQYVALSYAWNDATTNEVLGPAADSEIDKGQILLNRTTGGVLYR
jgi:hypothetical protein